MAVQVAADVRQLDQPRQRACARGVELAAVLAQLRLDIGEAEALVDLDARSRTCRSRRWRRRGCRTRRRAARAARPLRAAPRCAAPEPVKCCSRLPSCPGAAIRRSTPDAGVRARPRSGLAGRAHPLDLLELGEALGERRRSGGRGDQVDVLDGVRLPADRARELRCGSPRPASAPQAPTQRLADLDRPRQQDARVTRSRRGWRPCSSSALSTLSSSFGPSPRTVRRRWASAASRSACSESIAELGVQQPRALRAEAGQARDRDQARRELRPQPLAPRGSSPVCTSARIFSWSVLPIPGSSLARPSRASAATDTDASRTAFAAVR